MNERWLSPLEHAFAKRRHFLNHSRLEGTNCFRLFTGAPEGVAGLVIDIYASVGFLQTFEGKCVLSEVELRDLAKWIRERLELEAVYLKPMIADRSSGAQPAVLTSPEPLVGEVIPNRIVALEKNIQFGIFPYDGFSVGLFLDQRENRAFLAERYSQRANSTAMNLFSYTCGFSVHLAKAGVATTSVDISKKALERGRENFQLNHLPLEGHEFYASGAMEVLDRWKRKDRKANLVIADPPSFARSKSGETFSVKADWKKLLGAMSDVAENAIFFSCNYAEWTPAEFSKSVVDYMGKKWKEVPLPGSPVDFQQSESPLKEILLERN